MWPLVVTIIILVLCLIWLRQQEPFTNQEIPKTIWTYWDSEDLPEFIQKSVDKMRQMNPGWTLNVLHPKNLSQYLPEVDIFSFKFADTKPRQSDFVRLHVMPKYGGVWCDASIVPQKSFDWVIDEQKKRGVEFIGYYREGSTTKPEYPVIESWFFACIPGSEFVKKWRDELGTMNTLDKETDYKEHVKSRSVDIQKIPQPDYLNVYLAAQAVMQTQMTPDEINNKIYVIKSDDGPFKHSVQNNWDPSKSMKWLCDQPKSELPDVIKVYGNERRAVEANSSLKCSYKIFD
jgi:Capsular polysaccharide synthesis protein